MRMNKTPIRSRFGDLAALLLVLLILTGCNVLSAGRPSPTRLQREKSRRRHPFPRQLR